MGLLAGLAYAFLVVVAMYQNQFYPAEQNTFQTDNLVHLPELSA
jgi:hypothetical protein